MRYTEDQIYSALDAAPEAVREAASSLQTARLIGSFVQKYKLHIDTVGKISDMNRALLAGIMSPEEFLGEIVRAGVDPNTARKIIAELNEKIFEPIHKQMRESGAARPPMSGPAPAPKPNAPMPMPSPQLNQVAPVPMPPSPVRTAPPPPNLPGVPVAEENAPIPIAAVTPPPQPIAPRPAPTLTPASQPARAPLPTIVVPTSTAAFAPSKPSPVLTSIPASVPSVPIVPTPPPKPAPAIPAISPIYSTESSKPAVPETKPAPQAQTALMWQTPVPEAWHKKAGAAPATMPAAPSRATHSYMIPSAPEKVAPRTMETDMQAAAQRAAAPQAPAPAFQPVSIPVYQAPPAPAAPMQRAPEPSISTANPEPVQSSYVPPPRPVSVAPIRFSGDPYREPIEADAV